MMRTTVLFTCLALTSVTEAQAQDPGSTTAAAQGSATEQSGSDIETRRKELEERLRALKQGIAEEEEKDAVAEDHFGLPPTHATKEPEGIRVTDGSTTKYLRWGAPKYIAARILDLSVCFGQPREVCLLKGRWHADFGSKERGFDTSLVFFEEKFFEYVIEFDSDLYSFVFDGLSARLGKPASHNVSEVQNRMGVRFDQAQVTWSTKESQILLQRRSASDLTKGVLLISYIPISSKVPEEPRWEAPF